jgi:hypothetical protein
LHQPIFFLFSIFLSQYIHSYIHEGPCLFPHCSPLSKGPPWGAEPGSGFELSNSGLPYSKSTHYVLSYAAPKLSCL